MSTRMRGMSFANVVADIDESGSRREGRVVGLIEKAIMMEAEEIGSRLAFCIVDENIAGPIMFLRSSRLQTVNRQTVIARVSAIYDQEGMGSSKPWRMMILVASLVKLYRVISSESLRRRMMSHGH